MAKKAAPKAAAEPKPAAAATKKKAMTKSEMFATIAEKTGVAKKDVSSIFDAYNELAKKELGKRGPGQFLLPGMAKMKVVRKPATKAKEGRNPFTGEPMTIKAKPARNVVKILPLKSLKDSV